MIKRRINTSTINVMVDTRHEQRCSPSSVFWSIRPTRDHRRLRKHEITLPLALDACKLGGGPLQVYELFNSCHQMKITSKIDYHFSLHNITLTCDGLNVLISGIIGPVVSSENDDPPHPL